jgi:hypothetical protein
MDSQLFFSTNPQFPPNEFVVRRFGHGALNGIYYSPFVGQNSRKEVKNQEEKSTDTTQC